MNGPDPAFRLARHERTCYLCRSVPEGQRICGQRTWLEQDLKAPPRKQEDRE